MDLSTLTDWTLLGNRAYRWLIALALFVVVVLALRILRRALQARVRRLAGSTVFAWDDLLVTLLGSTRSFFLLAVAAWVASAPLDLAASEQLVVDQVLVLALLLQGAAWANRALAFSVQRLRTQDDADGARRTTLAAVSFLGRVAIFSIILLLALANFGIDVTALVASLGIASVAIGLALQGVLGDLFASVSIVLDKPFEIGDFIIVGDFLGTVEHIGLRTTRIRSLSGEQLIFTNDDLLGSRIRNYKRMQERRVVFAFGVEYGTPRERLERIPQIVRETIEGLDGTRFDRSHFQKFGGSSLDFESVYYVLSPDYNAYMDLQQAINLGIVARFEEEGIEFAFPSHSVYLHARTGFEGWTRGGASSSIEP